MTDVRQLHLFDQSVSPVMLPGNYEPAKPSHFQPTRIYLTKGSLATPERRKFVERICDLYSGIPVEERLDTSHNRLEIEGHDSSSLHATGKRTLVFGEISAAIRYSEERGNTCPNYWHFSPYGFCPFDCTYCYLAGTPGVKHSPTVKIYVNLPEMLQQIDAVASRQPGPTAFYLGKLQDSLALDPLTAYSTVMIPFFAANSTARFILLTKSTHVDRLLDLEHNGHTILTWSVNPPEISKLFERNVPSIEDRLDAMRRAAESGYPVRAVMMPIIPIDGWEDLYADFTRYLLKTVPVQRLTLGTIGIYKAARELMEKKIGSRNVMSENIDRPVIPAGDGRERYPQNLRQQVYSHIIRTARSVRPNLEVALCLEERAVFESTGLTEYLGKCNCQL